MASVSNSPLVNMRQRSVRMRRSGELVVAGVAVHLQDIAEPVQEGLCVIGVVAWSVERNAVGRIGAAPVPVVVGQCYRWDMFMGWA